MCYNYYMETMLLGYKYKGYPTPEQAIMHNKTMGCARKYWNLALADYKASHLVNTPASYKDAYPYLREVDSLALANVQLDLKGAIDSAYSGGKGFPVFKKKRYDESYTTNNQNGTIYVANGRWLHLPKMKSNIKLQMHRPLPGKIHSVTVTRTSTREYYYSILCEVEVKSLPKAKAAVGIDLGLKSFITDSNGETCESVRAFRDNQVKLRKEQRKLSRMCNTNSGRKLDECMNYQKQRRKVAKLQAHIANIRKDILHKLSVKYVRENDVICLEDLYVKGMVKNKHLSKAISDSGWGMFSRMIEYKAIKYGRVFVKVGRFYPSTQTCSACGHRLTGDNRLGLSEREWVCPHCGTKHDRDVNAAINIRNEGLRLYKESLQP